MTLSGYPSLTVVSTTNDGFTNFMTPSWSRNSAGMALTMIPAHSFVLETGAG
jgi:hypothetical protein